MIPFRAKLILRFRCRLVFCPFNKGGSRSSRLTKVSWPSRSGRSKPGEKAKPRECEKIDNSHEGSEGSPRNLFPARDPHAISSQQRLCSLRARTCFLCFSPPIELNVTCLVLFTMYMISRFALPGRSVPGALCSRSETGGRAEPWFHPFLVPFKLLLPMQYGSRQVCLSEAELVSYILFCCCCCYLPRVEVEGLSDQTGKEIRDQSCHICPDVAFS